jgi:hypothetical protein
MFFEKACKYSEKAFMNCSDTLLIVLNTRMLSAITYLFLKKAFMFPEKTFALLINTSMLFGKTCMLFTIT